MQSRLLNILCCPITKQDLKLEIDEEIVVDRTFEPGSSKLPGNPSDLTREIISGWLTSQDGQHRYPIVNGVPRMLVDFNLPEPESVNLAFTKPDAALSKEYRQTIEHFRTQWEAYAEEEKTFGMTVDESWKYFLSTLSHPDLPAEWFREKLFIDCGCGHGKYVDALTARGAEVVGFDITPEIERVYRRIGNRTNAHLVQANILHPPLKPGMGDFVMSNGVIHHTPDTRGAFQAISSLPASKGYLSIWVYPFRSPAFEFVSQALRAVTTRLPRPLLRVLCHIPVPLLFIPGWGAYSETTLKSASWRQCAQVIYDFFGPKYQTHHTEDQVASWYAQESLLRPWFGPNKLSAVAAKK